MSDVALADDNVTAEQARESPSHRESEARPVGRPRERLVHLPERLEDA